MGMKVSINYDRCVATAACMAAAPEVFEVKGDSTWILQETPGEDLREKVMKAVKGCPTQAISAEEV